MGIWKQINEEDWQYVENGKLRARIDKPYSTLQYYHVVIALNHNVRITDNLEFLIPMEKGLVVAKQVCEMLLRVTNSIEEEKKNENH